MPSTVGPCLPFAPLEALARQRPLEPPERGRRAGGDPVEVAIAARLAIQPQHVRRYRDEGVHWLVADVLAVRLGYHPGLVWGDEWWDLKPPEGAAAPRMPKPRRRKAGSIRQIGARSWELRVTVGRELGGKPRQASRTVHGTYADAEAACDAWVAELASGRAEPLADSA